MFIGHVDVLDRTRITGWAVDDQDPNVSVDVEIFADGVRIAEAVANLPRPDLQDAARFGSGAHGFDIKFASALGTLEDHEIIVRLGRTPQRPRRGHALLQAGSGDDDDSATVRVSFSRENSELAATRRSGPRYVIHVGPHKTGTKYIQKRLFDNRGTLFEYGNLYPTWWMDKENHSHFPLIEALRSNTTELLARDFEDLNESPFKTVVISSEDIVDLPESGLECLRDLIGGNDVAIVFYCRRWSELLPSAWQETIKQGGVLTLPEFLSHNLSNPIGSTLINFDQALKKLSDVFGYEKLFLVSYNNIVDHGGDIFEHFIKNFCNEAVVVDAPSGRENVSNDIHSSELLRVFNVIGAKHGATQPVSGMEYVRKARQNYDVGPILNAMEQSVREILVNDAGAGLRLVHELLFQRYGGRLIAPRSGFNLFNPASLNLPYVTQDYLLAEGVAEAIRAIKKGLG